MAERARHRLEYIDVLNVFATLGVVVLHCNVCFWDGPAGASWVSANVIECLFYWPVPIFFMITGVTLMGYRERMSTREFFARRVRRTVVPWLFWSLVGFAYWFVLAMRHGDTFDLSPLSVIGQVLTSGYVSVFWFFPTLFGIYLSIPVLAAVEDKERVFWYAAVCGAILCMVVPFACKLIGLTWNEGISPAVVAGYGMLYVVVGWVIAFGGRRIPVWAAVLMFVAGFLAQMLGTLVLSSSEVGVVDTFKGYMNLPAFVQAIGLFSLVKSVDFSRGVAAKVAGWCQRLSAVTLGVYLTHWFALNVVVDRLKFIDQTSLWWRIVGPVLVFSACAAFTWLARKVPVLRRVMG